MSNIKVALKTGKKTTACLLLFICVCICECIKMGNGDRNLINIWLKFLATKGYFGSVDFHIYFKFILML